MHPRSTTMKAIYHKDEGVLKLTEPLSLEEGAEVTVTIKPKAILSEKEKARRFRRAAGSWKDIVDENFKDDLRTMRQLRTRPEVESWR